MTGCPDPSLLDAFSQGSLPAAAREQLERHLDGCAECSQTIAELARLFGSAAEDGGGARSSLASLELGATHSAASPSLRVTARESSAPEGLPDPHIPRVLVGRYQLGRRLGAGGMGVVFEAYDPELHRQVAIKLLHPGESNEAELTRARLLREARAMARLAHPNVVAVHDVGRVGEQVFVAMELVEGETLGQWLAAAGRSRAEIVERFVQAGQGLQAAHEVGLVHRDFKPDNVLIGADGRARVTDFGLARPVLSWAETEPIPTMAAGIDPLQVSTAVTTAHGVIAGTPAYMAPEQWRGEPVDARSDQFSFCVALYEALFGVRPFEGDNRIALGHNVMEGNLRPLPRATAGRRSPPKWLRKAVLAGLLVEPERRHPSMAELLAALSRDRSAVGRLAAIAGAMAVGAGATVGVLAWIADETSPAEPDPAPPVAAESGAAAVEPSAASEPKSEAEVPPPPRAAGDEVCLRLAATAGGSWTPERRAAIVERIESMEDGEALRSLAMPIADRWVAAYTSQATALCAPSAELELVDARGRCLAARVARLEAWASRVTELQTFVVQPGLVSSLLLLPPLESCAEPAWLVTVPPAPAAEQAAQVRLLTADLAAAEIDAALLRLTAVGDESIRIATAAEALGYAPLQAEAQLLVGRVAALRYDTDLAASWLERAALTAETAAHTEAQAAAAIALVEQEAERLQPETASRWLRLARSLADRTHDPRLQAAVTLAEGKLQHAGLELQAAKGTLGEAVDQHVSAYGSAHPQVAQARVALASLLLDLGDASEAERLARVACDALRAALGPADLRLGVAQAVLARAQRLGGKLDEALRSVDAAERIPGLSSSLRHDYDHGDALLVRGDILAARGDDAAALEVYAKAEIYHYVGPRKAQPLLRRGARLVALGDRDAGLQLLERALTELRSHYGEQDPRLVDALRTVGEAERAAGRARAARKTLLRAVEIADEALGYGPFKARSLIDLAQLEQAEGHDARALELFDDAHVPWVGAYGMDHPQVVAELLARADLAFALGQTAYAGRLYRSTYERFVEVYGEGSPAAQRAGTRRTDDE